MIMNLNFFPKFKKSTWNIPNLLQSLEKESMGKSNLLSQYATKAPLCAINKNKNRFIVIRQFASRKNGDSIQIINKKPYKNNSFFPNSHIGMTLASQSKKSSLEFNVVLPDDIHYTKIELENNETINIFSDSGLTKTNFEEIKCLWSIKEYSERDILKKFKNLNNIIDLQDEYKISNTAFINDVFFGKLLFDKELDTYTLIYQYKNNDINIQLCNTIDADLHNNLSTLKNRIKALPVYEDQIVKALLKLKNEEWLEEPQEKFSSNDFKKEIRITDITMHTDDSLEIYHQANDLFWGHDITSNISSMGEYEESNLIG